AGAVNAVIADWLVKKGKPSIDLVVTHSHSHGDHVGGDGQFAGLPHTTVVGTSVTAVRNFFGIADWPTQTATFELGGRTLHVIPIPGHQNAHLAVYDQSRGLLLTGDTLYPGRLYISDWNAYGQSLQRLVDFTAANHPVTWVLGTHIEMSTTPGDDYPFGASQHPNEHRLQLTHDTLLELQQSVKAMGSTPQQQVHDDFIIFPLSPRATTNPLFAVAAFRIVTVPPGGRARRESRVTLAARSRSAPAARARAPAGSPAPLRRATGPCRSRSIGATKGQIGYARGPMAPLHLFETVIAMLFAVIALHYLAHRLNLPPAVALIAGGAALAFLPGLPVLSLDPELVLVLFLPPLLLDGAWVIPLRHLRRHLIGILSLAVGAVAFTTAVVAVVTHALLPSLPWAACAVLGAIVAPPDAIAARAVLQRVTLPRRLAILLEGESLLNDAAGLVLFRFAVAAAVTGTFRAVDALTSFLLLALGGAAVGAAVAAAWVFVTRRLRDDYLMIASSVLIGWASYILAERVHVSGVISAVVAGLICGWYQHVVFSAAVRVRGTSFWTVLIFLLEASVFILIGSSLRGVIERVGGFGVVAQQMAVPVAGVLLALTLARIVWVYGSDGVIVLQRALGWKRFEPLGPRAAAVLGWAGMRGVVTLAVALSVPETMPGRDFMLVAAFAVILVTVLIQGTTLGAVIRRMQPRENEAHAARLSMSQAEAAMATKQLEVVEQRAHDQDGKLIHPQLLERYRLRAKVTANYVGNEAQFQARLHAHFDLVLVAVAAGRAELIRLYHTGEIDESTLHELERDLDLEELGALSAKA
nr:Na+/H+ antiporter [Polyangiaceae bacterium]